MAVVAADKVKTVPLTTAVTYDPVAIPVPETAIPTRTFDVLSIVIFDVLAGSPNPDV